MRKRDEMLDKPHILSLLQLVINSMIHEHSCKVLYDVISVPLTSVFCLLKMTGYQHVEIMMV